MSNNTESANASIVIAILVVIMAAAWLGYAYYRGPNYKTADGGDILLLHIIVPIALIVLLLKLRHVPQVKDAIYVIIALLIIWISVKFLGILMPFLLGFGFAYLFHFFIESMQDIPLPGGKRLQLSRGWGRIVVGVTIICIVALLSMYMFLQIREQASDMSAGIQKFYNKKLVPFVVGTQLSVQTIIFPPGTPGMLIAGADRGVYKSMDNGAKWTKINRTAISIQALAMSPESPNTFIAGADEGIYRSINGGITWTQIAQESMDKAKIQVLLFHPKEPKVIYAGTDKGIYKSMDAGNSWKEIGKVSGTEVAIHALTLQPDNLNIIYAGTENGIYKSIDEVGTTWKQISQQEGLTEKDIQALVFGQGVPATLYAASAENVYKSEDSGVSWTNITSEESFPTDVIQTLSISPEIATTIYVGSTRGVYKSEDAGVNWKRIDEGKPGLLGKMEESENPIINESYNQAKKYLTHRIPTLAQAATEFVGEIIAQLSKVLIGGIGVVGTAFITLMVFIYAVKSFGEYMVQFKNLFPEKLRDTVAKYASEIDNNMRSFLRGQFLVIFIIGIISVIAYGIIGVPFFMIVGVLAGICNAIPTFGPFIGGSFAFLALLTGLAAGQYGFLGIWPPGFLFRGLMLLVAIFAIQAVDNSLISPRVMSKAVDVDPLVIMFSVLIGAAALGFWGVLLAIPIVVIIKSAITVSQELNEDVT